MKTKIKTIINSKNNDENETGCFFVEYGKTRARYVPKAFYAKTVNLFTNIFHDVFIMSISRSFLIMHYYVKIALVTLFHQFLLLNSVLTIRKVDEGLSFYFQRNTINIHEVLRKNILVKIRIKIILEKQKKVDSKSNILYINGIAYFKYHKNIKDRRNIKNLENEYMNILRMNGCKYVFKRDFHWRTWRQINYSNGSKEQYFYRCHISDSNYNYNTTAEICANSFWVSWHSS